MPLVIPHHGIHPTVPESVYLAPTATVIGDVVLGEEASLWFNVVVRGDVNYIRIGDRTNVQDGTIIHVDPDLEHVIGREVTIGHGAICHGVTIEDHALVGMGSTLLERSIVREGAVVGAGAVLTAGFEVPPYTLAVGVPAKIVKTFDRAERVAHAKWMVDGYIERARQYAAGEWEGRLDAGPTPTSP